MKDLALKWLSTPGALILDTETTGLGRTAEIVQLSIIDMDGRIIFNHLVRPFIARIERDAAVITGITNDMVKNLPTLLDYVDILQDLRGRSIIAYNAAFDKKMMYQTAVASGSAELKGAIGSWVWSCAMLKYAEYFGEWNSNYHSYRWQKLTSACFQQGIPVKDAHDALGDVFMTLALLKKVAGVE